MEIQLSYASFKCHDMVVHLRQVRIVPGCTFDVSVLSDVQPGVHCALENFTCLSVISTWVDV